MGRGVSVSYDTVIGFKDQPWIAIGLRFDSPPDLGHLRHFGFERDRGVGYEQRVDGVYGRRVRGINAANSSVHDEPFAAYDASSRLHEWPHPETPGFAGERLLAGPATTAQDERETLHVRAGTACDPGM